jgi:hypothetical protein
MKILISESQYNRILLEDALELTERISDHYEDRKKRIQESLNVVFEYGGPKNLMQTFGDSIPRLWNPSTNSLEKFVKPDKNMALGDSYIVGKFALGEEEHNSILKKLEFLENNHEKFFENTDDKLFVLRVHEYNLNPTTVKGQKSNFNRINFVNDDVKNSLPLFFNKTDNVNLFISDISNQPSVGDSIIVIMKNGTLVTIINDRSRDQSTKFGDDYKIMQFSDFKNRMEEIEVEEKEEELRKIKSSEEDELKKIKLSPKHISSITEPKTKVKSNQPPRTIDGFFRLLPTELENEVKDVYNLLLQARESTKEISDRYRRLGKFASDDMKSEIAGLGIAMLKEKIKGMLSNNISSKFMDSFNDMFDPKPLIREGFVYFNTEFGMLKLTEEQLESISYLL